jgi:hypothetical protein
MSQTLSEVEVDGAGRARCPDCGEFTVETMVSSFTGNVIRQGPCCERCQRKRDETERAAKEARVKAIKKFRRENIKKHSWPKLALPDATWAALWTTIEARFLRAAPFLSTARQARARPTWPWPISRRTFLAHGEEHCRFMRTVDLLKAIRNSFNDNSGDSEKYLLDYYGAKVPFLVLDDLGAEKVSDFVLQTLYDLLDRRYGECLETLITSNLSLEELAGHYLGHGDRLASRIAGMGPTLVLRGKDRRWQR